MIIYTALCQDRHMDMLAESFTELDDAIEFCKLFIENNKRKNAEVIEEEVTGWSYYAEYSDDGDYVRVEQKNLHREEYIPRHW